jgi:hypothetical protein
MRETVDFGKGLRFLTITFHSAIRNPGDVNDRGACPSGKVFIHAGTVLL